ncbi:MAG: hypothetical protein ACYTXT_17865 [Nostoc sp.]|uniref:hypothetical protein n=1 Tax=unclassified Nostoc TaxID=2593658 RepID=UPI001D613906|nr:hypothetical protein [Nostoc sp. JL31]MBN3881384.1 hypothetical protein [Nostoc sp. JL23]MBN3891752.1 hypothetical protein [Nostoc sp. JL31]
MSQLLAKKSWNGGFLHSAICQVLSVVQTGVQGESIADKCIAQELMTIKKESLPSKLS